MKRKMGILKKSIVALGVIFFGSVTGYAQNTPTLSIAAGKVGNSSGFAGTASNLEFYMEASGWPRAVTAGETVFMMGSWPNGNDPTITDDKSNTWTPVTNCSDSTNMRHGFFYAVNAAANTSVITTNFNSAVGDTVFDWAHFYNMSTTASGFADGSSCKTGVTPSNNTAPNISGTTYTTAASGDLILICVYVEQKPLGHPNPISSVTWPTGFTGLSDETWYGHACAYGIQAAAGSFTPTFTAPQSTHNSFTIISAAFKSGTGGSTPPSGASVLLSEMHMTNPNGQTDTVSLPCPSGTTAVAVLDDAYGLTGSVTDSNSNAWHHPAFQGAFSEIWYVNSPVSNGNAYTVSMTFNSNGGYDLVGLYCLGNTGGIDAGATAQNGSTLDGANSGTTYGSQSGSSNPFIGAPSIGTSVAGDLVMGVGAVGIGPVNSCVTGRCVFDYVGSTNWSGNGDNQSYSNGDFMSHQYVSSASTQDFEYNSPLASSGFAAMAIAFLPGSSQNAPPAPPAPPTNLHVTVQ